MARAPKESGIDQIHVGIGVEPPASNEVAPEEEVPAKELSETEQDMPDPDQGNGEPTREGDDVDPEPAADESDSNASTLVLGGRRDEDSDGDN